MTTLRETLERLGKEAAPGPWQWHFKQSTDATGEEYCHLAKLTAPIEGDYLLDVLDATGEWSSEDFKLIVAYRNNHAQILSELRVAEVVPQLEAALKMVKDYDDETTNITNSVMAVVNDALAALQSAKEPT